MDNQVILTADGQQSEKTVIIYRSEDGTIQLEVQLYNGTVWMNRQQMSTLFGRDIKTIGKHINNALNEELKGYPTVAKFATLQKEGNRIVNREIDYYSLDLDKHNSQYQPINIEVLKKFHDRFLIIDDDLYHIGASFKDLGKSVFAFSKMGIDKKIILSIL